MYLLLFNNLCCGLSLPPYGSKLLLMFFPDISSAELLVHPKQTLILLLKDTVDLHVIEKYQKDYCIYPSLHITSTPL